MLPLVVCSRAHKRSFLSTTSVGSHILIPSTAAATLTSCSSPHHYYPWECRRRGAAGWSRTMAVGLGGGGARGLCEGDCPTGWPGLCCIDRGGLPNLCSYSNREHSE